MRRALVVLIALGAVLALAGPAHAQVSPDQALGELDRSRRLIDRSVELYGDGRQDEAYEAARNAYLDHFELVEIPLRVRDEELTLRLEERYAELRNLIEAGAPIEEVEDAAAGVRRGLDQVERTLSSPGLAAPALATGYSFTILFREGLEAVLVVAAILGFLEASRQVVYRGAILRGVALAGLATVATFFLFTLVFTLAPVQREVLEAATGILAVVVLFYVSFWLVARLDQRRWMEFVKAKVWTAASTGSTLALAAVGFTAVYREGFETVLFYQALLSFSEGLEGWVWLGVGLAAAALGVVGFLIFRAGRRLPVKAFLGAAVVLIMVMSVAMLGSAVRELQEAAIVPVTFVDWLPSLPIYLADLTGWHPTLQTVVAQLALAAVYVTGAVWMFVIRPRRAGPRGERPVETAEPAEPVRQP